MAPKRNQSALAFDCVVAKRPPVDIFVLLWRSTAPPSPKKAGKLDTKRDSNSSSGGSLYSWLSLLFQTEQRSLITRREKPGSGQAR